MDPARWDQLEALMERANGLSDAQRADFVKQATRDDPELGIELSALLDASEGAEEYLRRLRHDVLGTAVQGMLHDPRVVDEPPDPWIGRTVSHYEILDRIGGGGMGVVYRARDVKLGRHVALKFIAPEIRRDSEARRRFLHEARAASALDHPHICTVHEIGETRDGRLFIVMAVYDGETLRARIERGPLPLADALDIAEQIAGALAAAHAQGIVHRDVKPDNVFITRAGVVKLLDFGLARTADGAMSGAGAPEGTVAYMSPEQTRGERADARSDVWALGVILFEMLAGVRPFTGAEDPESVIRLILTGRPDLRAARPDLDTGITDIVHRALSNDRALRFANGRQLLAALRARGSSSALPRANRRLHDRLSLRAAAIGVLLVAVTVLALRLSSRPTSAVDTAAATPVSDVLWVDDNPENNAGIVGELRARGVRVTTVRSTTEALAQYDPAVYQLVISDMARYEGTGDAYVERAGIDLLERLTAGHHGVRLIFYTSARAATAYRADALGVGARDIVADRAALLRAIGF